MGPRSMIETAARALAKQQSGTDDFDALDEGLQETLKAEVRAVLGAVREPSDSMAEAGRFPAEDDGPVACWTAMIDAALAE